MRRLYQNILIMAITLTQYNEIQIVILNLIVNVIAIVIVNLMVIVNLNLNLGRHQTHWKQKKTDAYVNLMQFPEQR